MNKHFIALVLFFSFFDLKGQHLQLGIRSGISTYYGDLSPAYLNEIWKNAQPVYGFFIGMDTKSPFSFKFNYVSTELKAGPNRQGFSFVSPLKEYSFQVEMNLFRFFSKKPIFFYPYGGTGIGFFKFNPQTALDGELVALQPLGTEGQGLSGYPGAYSLNQMMVPVFGGFKFVASPKFSIGAEISYQITFTDYIDDVSGTQIQYQDIIRGKGSKIARLSNPSIDPSEPFSISYRRGGIYNDLYYLASLTLTYTFIDLRSGTSGQYQRKKNAKVVCPNF